MIDSLTSDTYFVIQPDIVVAWIAKPDRIMFYDAVLDYEEAKSLAKWLDSVTNKV